MAAEYKTFEHDVLVIGAGGAGLRAAIEASGAGVKVGVVCKSLLGKAHTVMAEGGVAAAMANVVMLSGYAFGCHSFRHRIGGHFDTISKHPVRRTLYGCASCLNRGHMRWAWASLFVVAFSDIYVRLCSLGIWTDWRIF